MPHIVDGIPVPPFQHAPHCTGPDYAWRPGNDGDRLWRCHGCAQFKVELLGNGRRTARPATYAGSPLRCRDHHDVPVNAKGKGCHKCTADLGSKTASDRLAASRAHDQQPDRG